MIASTCLSIIELESIHCPSLGHVCLPSSTATSISGPARHTKGCHSLTRRRTVPVCFYFPHVFLSLVALHPPLKSGGGWRGRNLLLLASHISASMFTEDLVLHLKGEVLRKHLTSAHHTLVFLHVFRGESWVFLRTRWSWMPEPHQQGQSVCLPSACFSSSSVWSWIYLESQACRMGGISHLHMAGSC